MGGMVADAGEVLDHQRDPLQDPQVAVEPVCQGILAQGPFDPATLAAVQSGLAARPAAQRTARPPWRISPSRSPHGGRNRWS